MLQYSRRLWQICTLSFHTYILFREHETMIFLRYMFYNLKSRMNNEGKCFNNSHNTSALLKQYVPDNEKEPDYWYGWAPSAWRRKIWCQYLRKLVGIRIGLFKFNSQLTERELKLSDSHFRTDSELFGYFIIWNEITFFQFSLAKVDSILLFCCFSILYSARKK